MSESKKKKIPANPKRKPIHRRLGTGATLLTGMAIGYFAGKLFRK